MKRPILVIALAALFLSAVSVPLLRMLTTPDEAVGAQFAYPPFTMLYRVDEPGRADQTPASTVVKLEYRSVTDWTKTIVENSPDPDLSLTGYSLTYRDGKVTEHFPGRSPDTFVRDAEPDAPLVPDPWFIPRVADPAYARTAVDGGKTRYVSERHGDCAGVGSDPSAPPQPIVPDEAPCIPLHTRVDITVDTASGIPIEYTETTNGVTSVHFVAIGFQLN